MSGCRNEIPKKVVDASPVLIEKIHHIFVRHDRNYCVALIHNGDKFLYFSHRSRPLRSLIFGRDFWTDSLSCMKNEELCIECGLGLSIAGGVALDSGDCVEWHYTVEEANRVLAPLKERLGEGGRWIELF